MTKKTGLGKGLGALLAGDSSFDIDQVEKSNLISVEKIRTNKDQPRKHFDEESLKDLAESIKSYGLLQPLLVVEREDHYEIVAGERRFRASQMAGLEEVPAIVRDLSEKEIKEISIIENVQREDLNPIEEAMAYQSMMDEFSMTQKDIGESVGKSRSYVANILRLLKLDEKTKDHLVKGDITSSQARTLLSIKDEKKREKYLKDILNKAVNIRDLEGKSRKEDKAKKDIFVMDVENRLSESLEAKVQLKPKKKGGQIIIDFYDNDDLQRLIEKFEEEN